MTHCRGHTTLFFRRELEYVIHKQLGVVRLISLERGRGWTGKHPMIIFPLKQSRRHGCAGTDCLRVDDPALDPVWF